MHRVAVGRVVLRNGNLHPRTVGERHNRLHNALAVGLFADNDRVRAVTQCTGEDFGGRCAVLVDKDHQLHLHLAVLCAVVVAFTVLVLQIAQRPLVKEDIGDALRVVHPAAGVVAQVDNQALRAVLHHLINGGLKLFSAVACKVVEINVADFVGQHHGINAVDVNVRARERVRHFFRTTQESDVHIRARRTAHDIYRIVNGAGVDIQILHLVEDIALANARLMRRAVVEHAADGADARRVGAGNLHTHARVAALVVLPQLSVFLRGVVERIGIAEAQQQTLRRAVQHGLFVRLLIVILIDLLLQLNQGIILLVLLIKLLGDRYRVSVFGLRHRTG